MPSGIVEKNLGKVTAYAYAKAGGYTGTSQEFEEMLAGIECISDLPTIAGTYVLSVTIVEDTPQYAWIEMST